MLNDDVEVKAEEPPDDEIQAAWEIRNKIADMLENTGTWERQYELSDGELRDYLKSLVITGITEEQIGDVAGAIHYKAAGRLVPLSGPLPTWEFYPPEWRDPFTFTGLQRLRFAHYLVFEWERTLPTWQVYVAWIINTEEADHRWDWPTILKIREAKEQQAAKWEARKREAEEQAAEWEAEEQAAEWEAEERAAYPYEAVWLDERPLLLGYHDRQCLLPRYRDGGIGLIVGEKNHLKTTITIMLLVEAMASDPELHILYLAGEQPGDVKNKVVHYGGAAGLSRDDLHTRFHIRVGLPPLYKPENEEGILTAASRFNAGVVVIDTYQHAITGLDENSSKAAELSTNSGIFGRLKSDGRLVLILGHPPADGSPRFRGNTGIEGAADFILMFRATHSRGSFKAEVTHMRGTAAGAIAHATFPKVPANLTAQERLALPPPDIIWSTVREYNAVTHDPRPRAAAELVVAVEPPPMHPPTRKEKAAERKRRQREREQQSEER